MRILDVDNNSAIRKVILYLKIEEARELYSSIGMLLKECDYQNHSHVSDATYEHEVTVLLYDEHHMKSLNERSKRIILEDD